MSMLCIPGQPGKDLCDPHLGVTRRNILRVGGSAFVYAVRRARVSAVGAATRALVRRPARLRAAMRRLLTARASQTRRAYVPNPAAGAARLAGAALAGTNNARLNSALALLCYVSH